MVEPDVAKDRRGGERREGPAAGGGGRRGPRKKPSSIVYVLRSLGLMVVLVLVIVYTMVNTRPIYSTSGKLGDELRKRAPVVAKVIAPADSAHSSRVDQLMATPKFQEEKRNFYEDVMRLKQVDSARADSIAEFAVREAYIRGISPAIIFGVMLTENAKFVSKATSSVGAVGLMLVYPKIWLNKEMTALFGSDLVSDSTNVKYGVFILSQYFRPRTKTGARRERDWQTALLRYNGCVRGTNTPRCHTYPKKVQKFVEGSAKSICDGRGFYECIGKPFIAGLFGATNGSQQPGTTSAVSPTSIATPLAPPVSAPPAPPAPVTVTSPPVAPARGTASAKTTQRKAAVKKVTPRKRVARASISKKQRANTALPRKAPARSQAPLRLPKPINIIIPSP